MKKENLYGNMNADVWAREFVRITGLSDIETMRGWFANAIMTGYDFGHGPINGDHAQHILDQENSMRAK